MTDTVKLTRSQQRAYNAIMAGYNVFLTGHAGTGKSFLICQVINELTEAKKKVAVAAPTGIAAINVGGTTLHRLFLLKPDIYVGKRSRVPTVLKHVDVPIIDYSHYSPIFNSAPFSAWVLVNFADQGKAFEK